MKILVTGAAGFIASHVADTYINAGHEVIIADNLSGGTLENVHPKAKFYLMDVRSPLLKEVFEVEKPDVVNHHAAQMSVTLSLRDPSFDADVNVLGFINLLENCIKFKVKKVIFISSGGAIYGEASEYPTTEKYSPRPLSPYAVTKCVSESYLYYYHKQFGLNYTTLRYANVYGPRQDAHGEAGVVSIFINKLLNRETPTIYAYPDQPDGMVRDYIYVKDVVQANLLALDHAENDFLNIGTQEEVSTSRLYQTITKAMKTDVLPHKAGPRPGDIRRSCLNCEKAKRILGWAPKYNLEQGVFETYQYFSAKHKKK
ncbi:MAG: NAD-dependent epimerase/dehydratase family protein [bacterium]|nr:NAD-dependent epimerase/dehydratase family protein [bacterium]